MPRCLGTAIAGALLFAASGCSLDAFLSPTFFVTCVDGPKTVAAGPLSQVAAKLQDGLIDAGMKMWPMNRVGSELRLAGLTKSQMAFRLSLSAKKDVDGTKTMVRMRWDRGGDEELWQLILKILATPASGSDDSSGTDLSIPSGRDEK